ncbi:PIN domain-containing protein [Actinophytocola algeriensis]|uniref:PIN domain-containing protein n=1 Tax=Actinophytocola algeriensis TaxID=1768010 RepID=UPI0035E19985
MNKSLVLDAGALIGVDRRSPQLQELFRQARARTVAIVVPTVVVAQVVRSGGRQANLRRFLADSYLSFVGLDYPAALEIGALLGDSGTADVVDACVAVCARRLNHCPVVTSDPEDLAKLDPTLPLIVV